MGLLCAISTRAGLECFGGRIYRDSDRKRPQRWFRAGIIAFRYCIPLSGGIISRLHAQKARMDARVLHRDPGRADCGRGVVERYSCSGGRDGAAIGN